MTQVTVLPSKWVWAPVGETPVYSSHRATRASVTSAASVGVSEAGHPVDLLFAIHGGGEAEDPAAFGRRGTL
jgi:hypothetical protein